MEAAAASASAAGDSREETVSGEDVTSPTTPKPRVVKKRSSAKPNLAVRGVAARIRAKALLSSRKVSKGEDPPSSSSPGQNRPKASIDAVANAEQECPPVDEASSAQPPTKEARQMASLAWSPDGAGEPLSQPDADDNNDELLSLPAPGSNPLPSASPWEEPAPKRAKPAPEATFTPTAAGLRPRETHEPEISPQMRLIISQAIAQGIAAGMQQNQSPKTGQVASPAPDPLGQPTAPDSNARELPVAYTGLFNPALFKSLLQKAKATARMGMDVSESDPALGLSDSSNPLFSEPATDNEEIPSPKLFLDVVQRQWTQPGAHPTPSLTDKRFYNVAPNLSAALQMPTIDPPVAALASSTMLSNDAEDALNPEDRRSELTLRKAHYAAAWAVKAATAASFFNRTSLLWLKQIQDRIPATDVRTHQDLNKLIAAAEFSADATLNSARFASRAIASIVTARRLLWLRHWQADMKSKWKLASAPYKGDKLFGEALEPILIETKDKKKVLPSITRRPDQRATAYFRKPNFRPGNAGHDFAQPQRAYFQHQERPNFRGNNRQQFQSKRPFRGGGGARGRPFNRSSI